MASSYSLLFLCLTALVSMRFVSSTSTLCPNQSFLFLYHFQYQCPITISPNPPIEVDGNFLDKCIASKQRITYISVLFYASWCPFSLSMHPVFNTLSSMFPQIDHLAVEQSSAMPSIYSRYGIHSMPSILMVNQTSRVRYQGPKNLHSLLQFYETTTGLEPVQYFAEAETKIWENSEKSIMQTWDGMTLNGITKREPYVVLAMLFLCLRVLLYLLPNVLSYLKAFWISYVPHFNMEIFGETSQLFGRALHMIDVRRIWTKLRLCKTRNFHGAMNARAWASSLASVSLGQSSSARSSS
ncbi:Thioredoxin domain-containing protein [Cephalotus follicularis]|uniref:Thioredoxin domain-containing protein n=1 Tax=Cephalotus follicularis TaxID=3775 RepID=A0A1Q3CFH1_CEPFO|nr:Thioredoxin domain-containing protein [Cephalotus follicularis]